MIQFHQLSTAEVLGKLETDTRGLDEDKVLRRRRQYGWNELPNPDRWPLWKGLLKQFRNLFVIILLLAAVISYAMDHILDVYVILVVVLANATIGFIHEVRADMAIRSLQGMFVPYFSFIGHGLAKARTAMFVTMALTQLFNLLNMRSLKKTVFEIGYFTNTYINIALVASLTIQVTIIELPIFQRIFDFRSITFVEFMLLAALSSLVLWAGEFYKFVRSRLPKY